MSIYVKLTCRFEQKINCLAKPRLSFMVAWSDAESCNSANSALKLAGSLLSET